MVNRVHFASVKNSDYEFSHWNKTDLCFEIGVLRLLMEAELSGNSWREIVFTFLSGIWVRLAGSYKLYLYFSSPVWMPDTKINRHYGLWKKLSKEYAVVSRLNIVSETCHKSNSKIRYSGVACIQAQDIEQLLPLLIEQRVGVIFAVESSDEETLAEIERTIFHRAVDMPDGRMEHMLNIPQAINAIVGCSGLAVYPNGSEEFGGMYLDIFGKSDVTKNLGNS